MTDAGGWRRIEARAKVNLRLRIFPRGADGYHPIETIFCRLDLCDRIRLRLRAERGIDLVVSGSEAAPTGVENLVVQAAERFLRELDVDAGLDIELDKRVPAAAGLGGGSSDAAATLDLLAEITGKGRKHDLSRIAAGLGADVPFFATGAKLALGWGRGDRLLELAPLPPRPLLLLVPEEGVSTATAYAAWDEKLGAEQPALEPLHLDVSRLTDWDGIAGLAVNDFEAPVFELAPWLQEIKERLWRTDPAIALLAGSGSTVFGVYRDVDGRDRAAAALREDLAGVRTITAFGPA